MRRRQAFKRALIPDVRYNNELVARLINTIMLKGKKTIAHEALGEIFRLIRVSNKYIDVTAPWILAKDEAKRERLGTVLYNLAECMRIVGVALRPFLTRTSPKIFAQLGIEDEKLMSFRMSWRSTRSSGLTR